MKEKLRIGEFAKLKNISTETLRHYDRIGLLKPIEIDSRTGYRYYSIYQDEKLTTILDLRKLGMSLDDISTYFNGRNLNQSLCLLKQEHGKLIERIDELVSLEKNIKEKVQNLEEISDIQNTDEICFKDISTRYILKIDREIENEIELNYGFIELEKILEGVAPLLANNRVGTVIDSNALDSKQGRSTYNLFIFINRGDYSNYEEHIEVIPKGRFACAYFRGPIGGLIDRLRALKNQVIEAGYEVVGDCIEFTRVDASVTDVDLEKIYEIQIPIKKH